MLSYRDDDKLPYAAEEIGYRVVKCLERGSTRIVVTHRYGRYRLDADQPLPNRIPFWIGLSHWWFRVRNGE